MKLNSEDKLLLGFLFSRVYNPPFLTRAVFKEKPVSGDLARFSPRGVQERNRLK